MSNITQFSAFYYFYSTIFPHQTYITYFSFLIIFSCLFLTTHDFCLLDLNFITSLSTLLHLRFVFFFVHNFCVFYQYQCGSISSQVLSLKFFNSIFFSCTSTFVHFFSFNFFPFEIFWFTECKFVLVLRTFFFSFFFKVWPNLEFRSVVTETPEIEQNDPKFFPK